MGFGFALFLKIILGLTGGTVLGNMALGQNPVPPVTLKAF